MGLEVRHKTGKGYAKKYVVGRGVMDIPIGLFKQILPAVQAFATNKDLAKNIGKSVVDAITTAKNIKDMATPKKTTIENVIKEIKGRGFNLIK